MDRLYKKNITWLFAMADLFLQSSRKKSEGLKMQTARSSETPITTYQPTRRNIPQDLNFYIMYFNT
jgi:hypothetical protein